MKANRRIRDLRRRSLVRLYSATTGLGTTTWPWNRRSGEPDEFGQRSQQANGVRIGIARRFR